MTHFQRSISDNFITKFNAITLYWQLYWQGVMLFICRKMSITEANNIKLTRLGIMVSVMLHSFHPMKYKLVQQSIAIYLWRQGASHDLFDLLSLFGLSQTAVSARTAVDRLIKDHDKVVVSWQSNIQVNFNQFGNVLEFWNYTSVHNIWESIGYIPLIHTQSWPMAYSNYSYSRVLMNNLK